MSVYLREQLSRLQLVGGSASVDSDSELVREFAASPDDPLRRDAAEALWSRVKQLSELDRLHDAEVLAGLIASEFGSDDTLIVLGYVVAALTLIGSVRDREGDVPSALQAFEDGLGGV